jgi:hypothetical protein
MGYAKGVRHGHAGGHLREPACALVEAIYANDPRWWEVGDGHGVPFATPAAAYQHLGRLWHCRDIVPSGTRRAAEEIVGREVCTYSALVRALRPILAERMQLSAK